MLSFFRRKSPDELCKWCRRDFDKVRWGRDSFFPKLCADCTDKAKNPEWEYRALGEFPAEFRKWSGWQMRAIHLPSAWDLQEAVIEVNELRAQAMALFLDNKPEEARAKEKEAHELQARVNAASKDLDEAGKAAREKYGL